MQYSVSEAVYKIVSRIPAGRISTYKEVASAAGIKSARRIGNILSKNPRMVETPCHRVVKSDGSSGGYSGKEGKEGKRNLLKREGIIIKNKRVENFKKKFYSLT